MNIVGNAIKYTKKGYIYLHLQVDKNYVNRFAIAGGDVWKRIYVSVRDTGIGINQ